MPRWRQQVVKRIRDDAIRGAIRFTLKATIELEALGLDETDAIDILCSLTAADLDHRKVDARTDEWLYVFRESAPDGLVLYIKVILRSGSLVISFHEGHAEW